MDPCGNCGEGVGCNSIQSTKCQKWVIIVVLVCQDS